MRVEERPELWGGVECTINRVGDCSFEQLNRSGHPDRIADLDRFAELNIRALRQPVLWERTAPESLDNADWRFSDKWLGRLRELQIVPIVGLVHHGSGPAHTSLLDPAFPKKLAEYARAVASRYPWVNDYTPVNEPLTTARFSALYGHWYPHGRDQNSFVAALLNQCRATVLAMQEIRQINPSAKLVQTDDLGKVFSTPKVAYQAEFENERRWLGWDLLCGRVNQDHPLWSYLLQAGASARDVLWFEEHSCTPDIIGVNHYLSSERFLDDNVSRYPFESWGTNGTDIYADVLATRVCHNEAAGPKQILSEAWQRYGMPVAVTEAHNGCTREEQLRWLLEIWRAACDLRTEGVDVRAVTLWSLLGAHDWNNLVTRADNHYEPGVFDIRAPKPRATAIAELAQKLGAGAAVDHPLLQMPGWWKRPDRFIYSPGKGSSSFDGQTNHNGVRPILITGGRGTLGRAFERACAARGIAHRLLVRSELDIADESNVRRTLDEFQPWAVINAAGYVRVDDAERDSEQCFRENTTGPALLAAACASRGIRLMTFSSDLVFDGCKVAPYVESDPVSPLNTYGRTKAAVELRVLEELPSALLIRTSAFFSPRDEYNFVTHALRTMGSGQKFQAAADSIVSPTYVPDLVDAALDLFIDGESGILHMANQGAISWADLARQAAQRAGIPEFLVEAVTSDELGLPATRPSYSVLSSERAWVMPSLTSALDRFFAATRVQREPTAEATASAD